MVQEDKTVAGWDWVLLEQRARVMGRLARYLALVAAVAITAGFVTAKAAPGLNAVVSDLLLGGLLLLIVAGLSALTGEHVFLLDLRRYWEWLRGLRPYESTNFWEQHGHVGFSAIGGIGMLVLGIVLGVLVDGETDVAFLMPTAWSLIGWLIMGAIPLWWTILIFRLATMHHRAINEGELPVRPSPGPFGLLLLFSIVWTAGMVVVVLAEATFPLLLNAE